MEPREKAFFGTAAPARLDGGILLPGRNCWRTGQASRFAVCLHADVQRAALRQALLNATVTIFIVGWHIDSQTEVSAGPDDGWPRQLGALLQALLVRRPRLRVYVLAWDFCMLYSAEREWPPVYRQAWPSHRRLIHRLDGRHPAGGAHHQNFVVVDDALAFVGGLDLARDDRTAVQGNASDEAACVTGLGAQAVFDGEAAAIMGDLARLRWRRAAGRWVGRGRPRPADSAGQAGLWPPSVVPDLYDVQVGIARTEPPYAGRAGTGEILQLYRDAIGAAQKALYFESSYVTAEGVCQALSSRLAAVPAPRTVLVTQPGAAGWLDEQAMLAMRTALHAEVRRHDVADSYHAFAPVPAEADAGNLRVSSKVFIADDDLLCVGSANLNNRSMVLDSECQVAVEARGRPGVRARIAAVRARLVAARLGVDEPTAAEAIASLGVAGAILQHDPAGERLASLPMDAPAEAQDAPRLWLDRERPTAPDRLIAQFMQDVRGPGRGRRGVALAVVGTMAVALAGLWVWTPLSDYLNLNMLMAVGYNLKMLPFPAIAVVGCYVLGGLLSMPVTVLIAASGMVFGMWQGGTYALAGTMVSALVTYAVGRWLGRDTVRALAGARINALSERVAARGMLAMVILRLLPVAPFTLVNVMAGASHIRLRDYLLGTFLGMLPGIVLTVAFADRLSRLVQDPDLESVLAILGVGLLIMAFAYAIPRMVHAVWPTGSASARPRDKASGSWSGT